MTLTPFVSRVAYPTQDACYDIIALLRECFTPSVSLTPWYDANTRTWHIRYSEGPHA